MPHFIFVESEKGLTIRRSGVPFRWTGVEEQPSTHQPDWQVVTAVGSQIVLMFNQSSPPLTLTVFDASGRKVDELHVPQTGGTITWGEGYGAGVYFIRERSGNPTIHKVILVR